MQESTSAKAHIQMQENSPMPKKLSVITLQKAVAFKLTRHDGTEFIARSFVLKVEWPARDAARVDVVVKAWSGAVDAISFYDTKDFGGEFVMQLDAKNIISRQEIREVAK
jgi:hypothetical protein